MIIESAVMADTTEILAMELQQQRNSAPGRNLITMLRTCEPHEVFTRLSETFAITRWKTKPAEDGFTAEVNFCALASQARAMGAPSPCRRYCLAPLAEAVHGLSPQSRFEVQETLWDGERCRVEVTEHRQAIRSA
ncbi:MAG TPA: hypothetical protein VF795_12665 [Desulfuromonadaceae bacterium]